MVPYQPIPHFPLVPAINCLEDYCLMFKVRKKFALFDCPSPEAWSANVLLLIYDSIVVAPASATPQ